MSIFNEEKEGSNLVCLPQISYPQKLGKRRWECLPKGNIACKRNYINPLHYYQKVRMHLNFFFLLKLLRYGLNKVQVVHIRCITVNHTECWSLLSFFVFDFYFS